MSIIQKEFIRRILQEEGQRLNQNQTAAIKKSLHFRTGSLLNDRSFEVHPEGVMGGKLVLKHKNYLRFLDIKKKVTNPNTGMSKIRKLRLHNAITMSTYNSIAYRLMYDLTEDVVNEIRHKLGANG